MISVTNSGCGARWTSPPVRRWRSEKWFVENVRAMAGCGVPRAPPAAQAFQEPRISARYCATRRASTGLVPAARRAGTNVASAPTDTSNIVTAAYVTGSNTDTSNNIDAM
jgi:hypothetical protein